MKILFVCHRTPWPPTKGDKLRAFHQIRLLSRQHEIHLFALEDGSAGEDAVARLEEWCSSVTLTPFSRPLALLRCCLASVTGEPFTCAYFGSKALKKEIRDAVAKEGFDLALASTAPMAQYLDTFRGPRVMDFMDVDSRKWRELAPLVPVPKRWVFQLEGRRLARLEGRVASSYDCVTLVNGAECELLRQVAPFANVRNVSNGLPFDVRDSADQSTKTSDPSLILVGTMDYLPTVDGAAFFVNDVFPELRSRYEGLTFSLVGRSPSPALEALGTTAGIEVTGEVPRVEPFLERSWIFVAPHRTAPGLQNKILEAMAIGLPVVCSHACYRGLCDAGFEEGRDLFVCRSPTEYVENVSRLIESRELRTALAENARERLLKTYDWEAIGNLLEEIVAGLGATGDPSSPHVAEPELELSTPTPFEPSIRTGLDLDVN